jgi:peptidyl-prolyl cis-trans isomerase A (cyclophilin A)
MKLLIAAWLAFAAAAAIAQTSLPAGAPPATAPAAGIMPRAPNVRVTITTALGPIVLELEKIRAPITTANFLRYVDQKRFDGVTFYRSMKIAGWSDGGVIQGGTTDPKRVFPPIAHEPTSKTGLRHEAGSISMGRFAPGTARADFFITLGRNTAFDADPQGQGDNAGYAVFGRVIEGMDVVRKIHDAPVSSTKGVGIMKGQMLDPQVRILTVRRSK